MRDLMEAMLTATKEIKNADLVSAEDLIDTFIGAGYTNDEATSIVNEANAKRIIRIKFSLSARTAEEIDAGHTVVTLL